jgi:gamma-glutamylcyclotransferase (GGCT)/AIG2-like uncharacterized protein YtfP
MKDRGLIFAYGTLKVNTGPDSFARQFDAVRLASTPGTVMGVLYNLGYFPALILGGPELVHGEVHRYSNFAQVITLMDQIEGYFGYNHPNNLYRRTKTEVLAGNNEIITTAIVYEFAQSVDGYSKVHSGTWMIDGPKTQKGEQL